MEVFSSIFFALEILFGVVSAVIIIYLVIKKIQNKGKEDFEQRDN